MQNGISRIRNCKRWGAFPAFRYNPSPVFPRVQIDEAGSGIFTAIRAMGFVAEQCTFARLTSKNLSHAKENSKRINLRIL